MNPDRTPPPTLENLLRLKRAEVPTAEFWTRFETELRQRQLAAIVEKRPWWCAFPKAYVFALRHNRQIGSVAALAVASFFGYHEFHAVALPGFRGTAPAPFASVSAAGTDLRGSVAAAGKPSFVAVPGRSAPAASVSVAASGLRTGFEAAASQPDDAMPSARLIAANLAAAHLSGQDSAGNLGSFPGGFEAQPVSMTGQIDEPLAAMTTPADEHRARLMAGARPAAGAADGVSERVSERIASHLSDDRLYEQLSRYGVGATEVSIRF
jgi:hypothetical protein